MMKAHSNFCSIRNVIVSSTAIALISFPMFVSASILETQPSEMKSSADLNSVEDNQRLYARLQDASRDMCGSTNVRLTGSVRQATANEKCYEETLTVAVKRVDNPAITKLHKQNL